MGPEVSKGVSDRVFDHRDLAPTVASWLGEEMKQATGKVIFTPDKNSQ